MVRGSRAAAPLGQQQAGARARTAAMPLRPSAVAPCSPPPHPRGGWPRPWPPCSRHMQGGFSVTLGLKDVGHMRQLGREVGCPLPLADLAHQHLLTAESKWGGELDWGAIGLVARDAAGLPPPGAR